MATEFDDLLGGPTDLRSEHAIQNDALVCVSAIPDSLFYRNNTGSAWQGQRVRLKPGQMYRYEQGMVVLREGRPISFGLDGSGDLMGSAQGVPVAVEMKDSDGRQRKSQQFFERAWVKAGGIYVLARSAAEAERKVLDAIVARSGKKC